MAWFYSAHLVHHIAHRMSHGELQLTPYSAASDSLPRTRAISAMAFTPMIPLRAMLAESTNLSWSLFVLAFSISTPYPESTESKTYWFTDLIAFPTK